MPNIITSFYEAASTIDLIYLIITIFSLIKCYKKGFILSILSMAKWFLAYILTLIIFPKIKPYLKKVKGKTYLSELQVINQNKYFWEAYPSITSDDSRIIVLGAK